MVSSLALLYAMKSWKIISFTTEPQSSTHNNPSTLVPFKTLIHTLPLAISYLLYMVCNNFKFILFHNFIYLFVCSFFWLSQLGLALNVAFLPLLFPSLCQLVTMESVRAINVPMYTTLRRTTVAFTMIVEYFLTGSKHSYSVIGRYVNSLLLVLCFFFVITVKHFVASYLS